MDTKDQTLVDAPRLRAALARWSEALEAAAAELNQLDGALGDGDLGTTVQKCAANVKGLLAGEPAGLGATLKGCAQACAKASGSSFGTLLAVAFLTAAKTVGERESADRAMLIKVLEDVQQALSARGGAATGDKTMLDSLNAIAAALRRCADGASAAALKATARDAARHALDIFRPLPNRIGRARMFAQASRGRDDPGMVAVQRMVEAL